MSTSRKSVSGSKRRKPRLKRSRLLKRKGINFKLISDEDFRYLWAGYRRGVFENLPDFKEELTAEEFSNRMADNIKVVKNHGGMVWIVVKEIPIGVVSVAPMFKYSEPHVTWFPEATSRDKIQASVMFLTELKEQVSFLITAREADRTFFDHLCKYGLMRTVGKLRDHFEKGEHAMLFQSVR